MKFGGKIENSHLRSIHSVSVQYACPCLSYKQNWKIICIISNGSKRTLTILLIHTSARSRRIANSWLQKQAHSSISSLIFVDISFVAGPKNVFLLISSNLSYCTRKKPIIQCRSHNWYAEGCGWEEESASKTQSLMNFGHNLKCE